MVLGLDIPIMGAKIQPRNTPANLTTHSAKRNVMDLIRIIVVDSLSLPMPNKGASCVLDILLEVRLKMVWSMDKKGVRPVEVTGEGRSAWG